MHRANGLNRVAALADNLDIALCLQQNAQVFPCQRLIIDDQHSQHAFSSRGRRRVTRVKRSGSQVTLMPQSAPKRARSRLSTRFIPSPLAWGWPGTARRYLRYPAAASDRPGWRDGNFPDAKMLRCTVLNGVFHDRLQGKGRQMLMRQLVRHRHLDLQVSLKARLLNLQIGVNMLNLIGKSDNFRRPFQVLAKKVDRYCTSWPA
jgi:hypothetical protein